MKAKKPTIDGIEAKKSVFPIDSIIFVFSLIISFVKKFFSFILEQI